MPKTKITKRIETTQDVVIRSIVSSIGIDTIAKRKVCAVLLRQKGFSYQKIGDALGVSDVCAYGYADPEGRAKTRRITQLGVMIDGVRTIITSIRKREYTRECELCHKRPKRRLYYHHWLNDFPQIGLWLCFKCHMLAETVDERRELIEVYVKLKNKVTVECLNIE